MCEPLERRRLLSADALAPVHVEPDVPLAEDTSDVVVADGREQIYPPLAPAMWADESVGSFEEPEVITVAFFGRDPIDESPPADDANIVGPPRADASTVAPQLVAKSTSIARQVLGDDDATPVQ